MATEVLLPQDVFASRHLGPTLSTGFATASFARRRQATGSNPNPSNRLHRRPKNSCGRDGVGINNPMKGQVTILRGGGSPDWEKPRMQRRRRGSKAAVGEVLSSDASGNLMVFGRGWLGPEPAAVPRQVRVAGAKAGWAETYAGSGFSQSPSPRALPLPTFSFRKAMEGGRGAVDLSATADLRRLLRLD